MFCWFSGVTFHNKVHSVPTCNDLAWLYCLSILVVSNCLPKCLLQFSSLQWVRHLFAPHPQQHIIEDFKFKDFYIFVNLVAINCNSLWFNLLFPWSLMKSSILSCVYESFRFPFLWKCLFKDLFWVVCLLKNCSCELFIYSGYDPFAAYINCQCFLQFCDLYFLLCYGTFISGSS